MARILQLDYSKTEIECDCGNIFHGTDGMNGFACYKCGKFYEIVLNFCPEHMSR